jgi:hypothetical protein
MPPGGQTEGKLSRRTDERFAMADDDLGVQLRRIVAEGVDGVHHKRVLRRDDRLIIGNHSGN